MYSDNILPVYSGNILSVYSGNILPLYSGKFMSVYTGKLQAQILFLGAPINISIILIFSSQFLTLSGYLRSWHFSIFSFVLVFVFPTFGTASMIVLLLDDVRSLNNSDAIYFYFEVLQHSNFCFNGWLWLVHPCYVWYCDSVVLDG